MVSTGQFIASASVMCASLGRLAAEFQALDEAGVDELHFDIMDGVFVPNYTLGPDFVRMARATCPLPCAAHLMVVRPERYIPQFIEAGCDTITVHLEGNPHVHRLLTQIKEWGASPGIAINPATPLTKLDYLLPCVDRVTMMTVDPGFAGQTILPVSFERVRILRENIVYHEYPIRIEVDGNINVENAAKLARFGAEIFVLGSSSIFQDPDANRGDALRRFTEDAAAAQHTA